MGADLASPVSVYLAPVRWLLTCGLRSQFVAGECGLCQMSDRDDIDRIGANLKAGSMRRLLSRAVRKLPYCKR